MPTRTRGVFSVKGLWLPDLPPISSKLRDKMLHLKTGRTARTIPGNEGIPTINMHYILMPIAFHTYVPLLRHF